MRRARGVQTGNINKGGPKASYVAFQLDVARVNGGGEARRYIMNYTTFHTLCG